MAKILLWVNGLGFAALGLVCLVMPEFATGLSGLEFGGPDAPIEIRAQYGGLFLAIGLFAVYGAIKDGMLTPATLMLFLVYLGLASGRSLGALLDPGPLGGYTYGALAFEIVFSLLFALALRGQKHPPIEGAGSAD